MKRNYDMKKISSMCRNLRKSLHITQIQIAFLTNYSPENISKFERGKNDSAQILLWYLERGGNDFYNKLMKEGTYNER